MTENAHNGLADDSSATEMWAEIHRLRTLLKGPAGFDTWQDAATDERIKRVDAEKQLAALRAREAQPSEGAQRDAEDDLAGGWNCKEECNCKRPQDCIRLKSAALSRRLA